LAGQVRDTFTIGMERTLNEDVLLGFRQLTDIGIRALPPNNDPTTAMLCINQIGEGLIRLPHVDTRAKVTVDEDGTPRVISPALPFARVLETSVEPLRFYAASDPFVSAHLLGVLGSVARISGTRSRREALREEGRRVVEAVRETNPLPSEMTMVREAAAWAYIRDDHPDILRAGPESPAM